MTRQSRTQRRAGGRVQLTPRDQALLRALGRFRLARSSDLGRLFFPGRHRDVVASRLRRLYDGRYLDAHVLDLAAENVYALGPEGRTWLAAHGAQARGVPRPPWDHHLGIVGVWAKLAATIHEVGGVRLRRCLPEWELREQGCGVNGGIVPDALVELSATAGEQTRAVRLALELDLGTESLEVLRRKIRAFADLTARGGAFLDWTSFCLVFVLEGGGVDREAKVSQILASEWSDVASVWTPTTDLREAIAHLLGLPVTPAADSRCGNGTTEGASPSASMRPVVAEGGLSEDA